MDLMVVMSNDAFHIQKKDENVMGNGKCQFPH